MKKNLSFIAFLFLFNSNLLAQCPPGANAIKQIDATCPGGCNVFLYNWPPFSNVFIYKQDQITPPTYTLVATATNNFAGFSTVCVNCVDTLVFASASIGSNTGCVIANTVVLPFKLNSFNVSSVNGKNTISWSTFNEYGGERFIIQRSTDGVNFSDVYSQWGSVQSIAEKNYSYVDFFKSASNVFYRLKNISPSNKVIYSDIVVLKNQSGISVAISPNPFSATFKLSILYQYLPATLAIYNAQGSLVSTERITSSTFEYSNKLANGLYVLKITANNNETIIQKIVKQ